MSHNDDLVVSNSTSKSNLEAILVEYEEKKVTLQNKLRRAKVSNKERAVFEKEYGSFEDLLVELENIEKKKLNDRYVRELASDYNLACVVVNQTKQKLEKM